MCVINGNWNVLELLPDAEIIVEKGKADGFVQYSLSELENLSDEEKAGFIYKMLEPGHLDLYQKILGAN